MNCRRFLVMIVPALAGLLLALPAFAQAEFGLAPGKLSVTAENSDGTVDLQASSHPYALTVGFQLNVDEAGQSEGGELRDVIVDLPPGLIGNPQAVPRCPRQLFEGSTPQCPFESQVGVLRATVVGVGQATGPIYNLVPQPGVAAQLGFSVLSNNALLAASVLSEDGYGLNTLTSNVPLPITVVNAEVWGTPASAAHDADRARLPGEEPPHPSAAPLLPFLTMPATCSAPLEYRVEIDSKQAPGQFVGETVHSTDAGGNPAALAGCEAVPFSPSISAAPTSGSAETSSGLDFELKLPNQGLLSPNAITETEPEKTEVTLPEGVTVNPAAASGLSACSPAQFKAESAESLPGQGCPESSKVGTLFAETPLLEESIEGSVYVASPHDNPFGSLLAIYIVARVPERGVLVKQAGEVVADPVTGQLRTTVDGLPPLPYSSFELRLREGSRAPLITPRVCGTYVTQAKLYPFSAPNTPVERTAPFKITSGAGGAGCVPSEVALPNAPSLEAGTTFPLAATYSPFTFKVSRSDGDQRFGAIEATLPEGLVGKLAGIPYCSEAQIAAARARSGEGGGAAELASPSCPQASQVGVVNVGAGAGSPLFVQGKAYLAGPYEGAPLSMVIVTPALAGPFDLGAVVVRAGLFVDESSAQITVKSDPIPQMLQGIPLDVRSVAVQVDRSQFTLNPTSCEAMAVDGAVTSTTGAVALLRNRFQVGGCAGLGFKPKLALSLKGGTKRNRHPALKAVVTYPQGGAYANIAKAAVTLPASEFIDQDHINSPCTRPQFRAHACPPTSILGKARAFSPLLDKPLEGPVYFRSNGGERQLPDVVVDLNGQVHLVLVGFVDSVHKKGSETSRIRNTFAAVPDAPVSKFVLELNSGKKKGLLVNSEDLCLKPRRVDARFTAHNGKSAHLRPKIATSCPGKGKKGHPRRSGG